MGSNNAKNRPNEGGSASRLDFVKLYAQRLRDAFSISRIGLEEML
jgi:hypothetical protein